MPGEDSYVEPGKATDPAILQKPQALQVALQGDRKHRNASH